MNHESPDPAVAQTAHQRDGKVATRPRRLAIAPRLAAVAVVVMLLGGGLAIAGDGDDDGGQGVIGAAQVRQFIASQVGGIQKLMVPPDDASIPLPPDDSSRPGRYAMTEAKRFLGKMLFHDPVRTARVNINQGQPVDLPAGTAFGGTLNAADPKVQDIVNATRQTGSCGSCHIGEAAGKAGQLLNFNTGGEGRGYTDENGNFFPRRRPQSILVQLRSAPIFPGDVMVDALPTLTDVDCLLGQLPGVASSSYHCAPGDGQPLVANPSLFYHAPPPTSLLATGRLDQIDSVGRKSPGMIGFAFNNRLLLGGFAGEPPSNPGSLNPLNDPAQENLTLLLLDAHRMINFESAELLKVPAFVKLFQDAFPDEAAQAATKGDPSILVNDQTVLRATATFLRAVVTRDTPFDRFVAGENRAMTSAQLRGAKLFFTPATSGAGGAGCFGCHSGPMLNKQPNDPDVAGVGKFVEENFFNVGIGDHPVQALNALAKGRLDPNRLGADGFPYHAEDTGRQEITLSAADAFKFRSLTLRQLKDARNFFHSGSFTKVREVVEYFNAGVPQDPTAGGAATLSPRFTTPRGTGYPRGLGLSKRQVDDLTDFLENALYDPALVKYDPKSATDTLQPNVRDLTYSKYRPDLAALGAKDGLMPSGRAIDDNDALARRDQGLEFLDVTSQLHFGLVDSDHDAGRQQDRYRITNNSTSIVDTHLLLIAKGLSGGARLINASGVTSGGDPYLRVFLPEGVLMPGQSVVRTLSFQQPTKPGQITRYSLNALSGQGTP